MIPVPSCFKLDEHDAWRAFSRAWAKTGKRIAARMAMIAITTSSSIRVKPRLAAECGVRVRVPSGRCGMGTGRWALCAAVMADLHGAALGSMHHDGLRARKVSLSSPQLSCRDASTNVRLRPGGTDLAVFHRAIGRLPIWT